jgi:hypothetical protein
VFPGHELVPGAHPQRSCHLLAAAATGQEVIAWVRTLTIGGVTNAVIADQQWSSNLLLTHSKSTRPLTA